MSKSATLTGRWYIKLYGENGELKDSREGQNVITETGLSFLASFLQSATVTASTFVMNQIAIGTDATAEAASNTALGTESARTTGTASYVSNAVYRVTATFPSATGTGAVVEYGLFSTAAAGTMMSRDTEAAINKGANDILVVTTEITLA